MSWIQSPIGEACVKDAKPLDAVYVLVNEGGEVIGKMTHDGKNGLRINLTNPARHHVRLLVKDADGTVLPVALTPRTDGGFDIGPLKKSNDTV